MSLPSRERGLKSYLELAELTEKYVAPFTGAWIEIALGVEIPGLDHVAPFTGAWIEIG